MGFLSKRLLCLLLVLACCLSGCVFAQDVPSTTPPPVMESTPPATEPSVTDPAPTTEPTAPPTEGSPTESTEPSVTDPAPTTEPTVPPTTEPAPTIEPTTPPATEPPPTTEPTAPPMTDPAPTTEPTVPPTAEPTVPENTAPTVPVLPDSGAALLQTVFPSGELVKTGGDAIIDYSNAQDGYVMVQYTANISQRLKVQIKGPNTPYAYTYNLTPLQWTAFPLSDENGAYQIKVLRNVSGSKYATVLSLSLDVVLPDAFAPFLRANQFVNFDNAPNTQATAAALAGKLADPLKKVEAVYHFVVQNLTYDTQLAATVPTGYLPDLDGVLAKKTGICFDYAALMTGMLRSLGVPTKLVVGYAGDVYHAWISVWSESTGWIDGVIYFDGVQWNRMDPTFASSGGSNPDILQYIGNGSNYLPKYFY